VGDRADVEKNILTPPGIEARIAQPSFKSLVELRYPRSEFVAPALGVWCKFPVVSEAPAVSVFRVRDYFTLKMEAVIFSEMSVGFIRLHSLAFLKRAEKSRILTLYNNNNNNNNNM
jgi:hypothetical protein